jgi:DNA repair protein RadC
MDKPHRPPRWRIALVREPAAPVFPAENLRASTDVWQAFRFLEHRDREEFWIAALDGKNRLIGSHQVSVGTLTASLVHPRLCAAAHKRGYVAAAVMWRSS